MKIVFSITVLICTCCAAFLIGQIPQELTNQLETATAISDKIAAHGEIAQYLEDVNQDSALYHYDLAIQFAIGAESNEDIIYYINNKCVLLISRHMYTEADSLLSLVDQYENTGTSYKLIIRTLQNKGVTLKGLGQTDDALKVLKEANERAQAIDTLEQMIPSIMLDIGSVYFSEGDIASSSRYLLEAIDYFKNDEDWRNVAVTYLNLAINNMSIEDFERAREYAAQGLLYSEKSKVQVYVAHSYLTLTAINSELDQHEDAVNFGLKSIESWQQLGNPYQLGLSQRFVGKALKNKSEIQQALPYLKQSESAFRSIEVYDQLIYSLLELGDGLYRTKQYDQAKLHFDKAEKLFDRLPKNNLDLLNIYKLLEDGYFSLGDYSSAYDYRIKHDIIKDSVFQEERIREVARLETEYEVKTKETQLLDQQSKLKRQRILLFGLAAIGVLLLLISVLVWRNLQQGKIINKELVKLDQIKSRFFANISHELRTPLTLIIGPLEKALNRIKGDNAIKKDISLALSNTNQLHSLINEIMDLSKIESGKLDLKKSDVNLYKLTNRIFSAFESMAEIKKVHTRLEYNLDKNLMTSLDISKYEKILNNLISNAIKFTPPDGIVTLSVISEEVGSVQISVEDTGTGIASDQIEKVFDRYYQGGIDGTYQGGTGIGLALSKELSQLHGGVLSVKSGENEGSTFTLHLPLFLTKNQSMVTRKPVSQIDDSKDEYQPILATGKKSHVLVIDDHEAMRTYLKDILSPFFNLTFAVDGKEALEKVELERFDAITCDVMMPNMDGFDFLKEIRKREMKSHTPVILLTARTLEDDKLRGLKLGTDDYITKPFNAKELIARLENLVEFRASREEELADGLNEVESADLRLLKSAESFVLSKISDETYGVNELSADMNYSSRQLSRILKKLTGLSSNQFIREIRLQHAYDLLTHKKYATISEVRYQVGIPHASYFSREFERRFGLKPSEVTTF